MKGDETICVSSSNEYPLSGEHISAGTTGTSVSAGVGAVGSTDAAVEVGDALELGKGVCVAAGTAIVAVAAAAEAAVPVTSTTGAQAAAPHTTSIHKTETRNVESLHLNEIIPAIITPFDDRNM